MKAVKIHKLGPRDVIVVDEVPGPTRTGRDVVGSSTLRAPAVARWLRPLKPGDTRYDV